MSQYPPAPGESVPFATPYGPPPRPTSVTVIAILAIVFGSLGVLASLCSLPQYLGNFNFGQPNPVIDEMRKDGLVWAVTIGGMFITLILGILQLWGGIGAFPLKLMARKVLVIYAILSLALGVLQLILSIAIVNPRVEQAVEQAIRNNPNAPLAAVRGMMKFGMIFGMIMGAVMLIWPALVLFFMTRPHVKAAFEDRAAADVPPPAAGQGYYRP